MNDRCIEKYKKEALDRLNGAKKYVLITFDDDDVGSRIDFLGSEIDVAQASILLNVHVELQRRESEARARLN